MTRPPEAIPASELAQLFEEFSRATERLQSAHDSLLAEVNALKGELAAKNRLLERKKRLEALGRVAAGVAHEFRNPLGGMRLTIDALIEDATGQRAPRRLEHIRRAITHLDRIVGDLLTFARSDELVPDLVAARELVAQAAEMALGEGRSLTTGGPAELRLRVDQRAFTQVLVNLLLNADQAVGGGAGRIGVWWGLTPRGHPWLEVADDGPGIPEGAEERIFELFHSEREGGTGLGLAIVNDRVTAHEGEISVVHDAWGEGADWSGARFRIVLPVSAETERETED